MLLAFVPRCGNLLSDWIPACAGYPATCQLAGLVDWLVVPPMTDEDLIGANQNIAKLNQYTFIRTK
jgi:hypothetical protein